MKNKNKNNTVERLMSNMDVKEEKNACKGVIMRANVSHFSSFVSNTRFQIKKTFQLTFQKKKSCPGCEYCSFIHELVQEINIFNEVENFEDIEHGKLYDLIVENDGDNDGYWLSVIESEKQDKTSKRNKKYQK